MEVNSIVVADAFEFLESLPDESIDLVLTDPPYESMMRWAGKGTTARMGMGAKGTGSDNLAEKFFKTIPNSSLPELFRQFYRVLKPGHHCYVFCDWRTMFVIWRDVVEAGIFPSRKRYGVVMEPFKPLVWDKIAPGLGYSYRARYEIILFLWKWGKVGRRRLADLGVPDVLGFKRVHPGQAIVPTQKPDGLFELLIRQSTEEKEIVLDPFMGSGTTARAAVRAGRQFVGCDISEKAVEAALKSVAAARAQPMIPGMV